MSDVADGGPDLLTDPILPAAPDGAGPLLHNREYRVQSYHLDAGRILVQGAVRDQKPPGIYIPDDPEPLTIHHMIVTLEVALPSMEILSASTEFRTFPNDVCPDIVEHYDNLVGLSLRRGFTHQVREWFGGPRGCSHTTALIQAMAPVAMQSVRGHEAVEAMTAGLPHPLVERPPDPSAARRLTNTCHVWIEGGDRIRHMAEGGEEAQTLVVKRRLDELAGGSPASSGPGDADG